MYASQLDKIAARDDLSRAFDEFDPDRIKQVRETLLDGFVLYGAGSLGIRTLKRIQDRGFNLRAVVDSYKFGSFTEFGQEILSIEQVKQKIGTDIPIVVTVWQGGSSSFRYEFQNRALQIEGFNRVLSVVDLYWAFPEFFLPYLICDQPQKTVVAKSQIIKSLEHFSEVESLNIFCNHVKFRVNGDFSLLARSQGVEYWDEALVDRTTPVRLFDLGAFDGDTIRSGLAVGVKFDKVAAFEPDPTNYTRLKGWADQIKHSSSWGVAAYQFALSDETGAMSFVTRGDMTSSFGEGDENLTVSVRTTTIDECIKDLSWTPTHIKMDIEGAELAAIRGAENTIRDFQPTLMVALEHNFDDLWTIPSAISRITDGYSYFLRHYSEQGFDVVLYAVPKK